MVQRDAVAQEREAAAIERFDNACNIINLAATRMNELTIAMMQREAEADVRNYNRSLDLRLVCGSAPVEAKFNWMFGHGVTPRVQGRATKSQARFDRLKVNLKKFGLWFTDNATDEGLSKIWIQFNDTPRVVITGHEIKDVQLNNADMSGLMESTMVRVLRRDEIHREVNSNGSCHYVGKEWANKVVEQGSTAAQCEELFHMKPKAQYNLSGCKKPFWLQEGGGIPRLKG